jgi:N-acetylmuramic acid 6-phosphate etherase
MLPITEQENPRTANIDRLPTLETLRLINNEDKIVATAVEDVLVEVASVTDKVVERLRSGGRVF